MTYLDIYNIEGGNPTMEKIKKFISDNSGIFALILAIIIVVLIGLIYSVLTTEECPQCTPCVECPQCAECPTNTSNNNILPPTDNTSDNTIPLPDNTSDNNTQPPSDNIDTDNNVDNTPPGSEFANYEQFTNDLPYQLNNTKIKLNEDEDYETVLQKMSLDNNVIKQHNQYVNDRNKITSTASFVPARTDNQDIVTYWGLPRRPQMFAIDPSAREVPSQDPEQGSSPIRLRWN
jgi:hypothetical protein